MPKNTSLNQVASWYSSYSGLNGFMIRCVFDVFRPYLQAPLLEIGAADGFMTSLILESEAISQLDIVEASSVYADKLRERFGSQVKVYNEYLEKIDFAEKYQTIIASHVLEHVEDTQPFLAKVHSLLTPDGYFLVSVPNAQSIHRLIGVSLQNIAYPEELNDSDRKIGHYHVFNYDSLRAQLAEAGFSVRQFSGSILKALSNSQLEAQFTPSQWEALRETGQRLPNHSADLIFICQKTTH